MKLRLLLQLLLVLVLAMAGCALFEETTTETDPETGLELVRLNTMPDITETATVTRIIDGDTIDVRMPDGRTVTIRYVGVNTPERDEPCYVDAMQANRDLLPTGTEVQLVRDQSNTDRFDRLLRYVFVDDISVGATLVRNGFAEAVLYEPDDRYYDLINALEDEATAAGLGCHPTGIFDDNTRTR